jgi:hypothetical protein
MMFSMDNKIEDHKCAFPNPNNLLLLLARAMQDSFTCLDLLKTTFTEMTIGITKFQHYYLELYGCLDYLKIYKPRIDGARPPEESVMNCMGAITNIPCIVQDFYTAGLPVWLIRSSAAWDSGSDSPVRCNILEIVTPLKSDNVLCVSENYLLICLQVSERCAEHYNKNL